MIVRLELCKGCSGGIYAYISCNKEKVKKALELEIACTGANSDGAYNIYFNDEGEICCEYMRYSITKEFKKVSSIEEAVEWMDELMN